MKKKAKAPKKREAEYMCKECGADLYEEDRVCKGCGVNVFVDDDKIRYPFNYLAGGVCVFGVYAVLQVIGVFSGMWRLTFGTYPLIFYVFAGTAILKGMWDSMGAKSIKEFYLYALGSSVLIYFMSLLAWSFFP